MAKRKPKPEMTVTQEKGVTTVEESFLPAGRDLIPMGDTELRQTRDPLDVLKEAQRAAVVLTDVLKKKKDPVMMNGEQYLEFDDWQTLARFYGITAKVVQTNVIEIGKATGFEATAVAFHNATGQEVSAASAMCLNDEDKWSTRPRYEWRNGIKTKIGEVPVPLFQLRSMAQTRACAKVLRNVLSWVVVLAGYKATPAEELTGDEQPRTQTHEVVAPAQPKPQDGKQPSKPLSKYHLELEQAIKDHIKNIEPDLRFGDILVQLTRYDAYTRKDGTNVNGYPGTGDLNQLSEKHAQVALGKYHERLEKAKKKGGRREPGEDIDDRDNPFA